MTYQSPQPQNTSQIAAFLQQILQQRKQQAAAPTDQVNPPPMPLPGLPQVNVGNQQTGALQALSQLFGYNPDTTMGYNMNPNSGGPSQNFQQSGGMMGLLNQLFSGNLFGGDNGAS